MVFGKWQIQLEPSLLPLPNLQSVAGLDRPRPVQGSAGGSPWLCSGLLLATWATSTSGDRDLFAKPSSHALTSYWSPAVQQGSRMPGNLPGHPTWHKPNLKRSPSSIYKVIILTLILIAINMDSRLSVSSPRRKFIHVCVCRLLRSAGMQGLGVPCSLGLLRFAHCCRFLAAAPFLPELDVPSHHGMQTCSFFCLL